MVDGERWAGGYVYVGDEKWTVKLAVPFVRGKGKGWTRLTAQTADA